MLMLPFNIYNPLLKSTIWKTHCEDNYQKMNYPDNLQKKPFDNKNANA